MTSYHWPTAPNGKQASGRMARNSPNTTGTTSTGAIGIESRPIKNRLAETSGRTVGDWRDLKLIRKKVSPETLKTGLFKASPSLISLSPNIPSVVSQFKLHRGAAFISFRTNRLSFVPMNFKLSPNSRESRFLSFEINNMIDHSPTS